MNAGCIFTDEIEYENQKRLEEEEEDLNVLTFEDLLCFAYQVAKGMEFLEFKSVSTFERETDRKCKNRTIQRYVCVQP